MLQRAKRMDPRVRFWAGVGLMIALVLAVPAVSRTIQESLPHDAPPGSGEGMVLAQPAVSPSSWRYRVRPYVRLRWGEGTGMIALKPRTAERGRASAAAYSVGDDGAVWIVDYPARFGQARAQRVRPPAKVLAERTLDAASTGFGGTPAGDLFWVVARGVGSEAESVRRLDARGVPGITYEAPPQANLTGVAISADGAVFGRTEVWEPDPDRGISVLESRLTYLGNMARAAQGRLGALPGHTFVGTGELVSLEARAPFETDAVSERFVRYYQERNKLSRSYRLDPSVTWIGGDDARNVYVELARAPDRLTVQQNRVGDVGDRTRRVAVYDEAGEARGVIVLPWDPIVTPVSAPIQAGRRGRVYIAGADEDGFVIWAAEREREREWERERGP